jgi:hypothetical protein
MKFNKRETATVLAALREFQTNLARINAAGMEHFNKVAPLTAGEIDALCERVNCERSKILIVIESGNLHGVYSDMPLDYDEYNIDEDAEDPVAIYEGQADPIKKFNKDWRKTLKKHRASER